MPNAFRKRLFVEPLCDRSLPSVSVVEAGGVLTILGDQRSNDIQITDNGTNVAGSVKVVVDGETFDSTGEVTEIVVKAAGQADTVTYDLTTELTVSRSLDVWLGNQHDSFTADLPGVADGATLDLVVYGGNGHDDLSVTGAGALAGNVNVEFYGQNGKDTLFANFGGVVSGDFNLLLSGGNGVDSQWAELTVDAETTDPNDPPAEPTGNVTVELLGWNGKDDLTLLVNGDGADGLATSDLSINGGHGRDTFNFTDGVTVVDAEAH